LFLPAQRDLFSDSDIALSSTVGHAEPEAQSGGNAELAYERMELFAAVKDAIDDLGPHETELIRRHYFQGQHLEDIAADLGMSKPSVHRRGLGPHRGRWGKRRTR
jgi:RNA polymerase sigma factor (sigma-70 family)